MGYIGGKTKDPTYKDVCEKDTGHAEAVEVLFNPNEVSYEVLLDLFWKIHDPTTKNRQGPDIGSQYRSAIFTHNDRQEKLARKCKESLKNSGRYSLEIVTEIVPAGPFYRAEEYHQRYHEKHGGSCSI